MLLAVFRYLDDISLWQATKVCIRWRNILNAELYEDQWKQFIDRRWPLFQPQYNVTCWKIVYSKMYVTFYPHVAMLAWVYAVMCLSLCVSVTLQYCIIMAKHRIMQSTPRNCRFMMPKISAKFEWGHLQWGHQCRWGRLKSATFDTYSLLLENHTI